MAQNPFLWWLPPSEDGKGSKGKGGKEAPVKTPSAKAAKATKSAPAKGKAAPAKIAGNVPPKTGAKADKASPASAVAKEKTAKAASAQASVSKASAWKTPAVKIAAAKAPASKATAAKSSAAKAPATKSPSTKAPATKAAMGKASVAKAPPAKASTAKSSASKPAPAAPMAEATLPHVHEKPGHLIRRAQQIAVAIFLEECAAFDLTPVQYAALVAVRDNPGIDATRIAGMVAFDRTTVSGVLERLESKGLIARTANEADRRAKLLEATSAGKKILKKAEPTVEAAQQRILAPLNGREQIELMRLLTKLVDLNNDASRAPMRVAEAE